MARPPNRHGIGPDEYLWAPEVHSYFGESLNFLFVRTAYSIRTVKEFQQIIADQNHAVTAYLIFGQFDFLVRSWGTRKENEALYQKLAEFAKDNLGACKLLEVGDVFYVWSPAQPTVEDVRTFCEELAHIETEPKRGKYISKHYEALQKKSLVLDKIDARIEKQSSTLKAFSVIRNVALSAASFDLLNKSVRSWLLENALERDATLYKTRGEFDFVVRWAAPDFPKLAEQIIGLTRAIDADGAAAIFETYFVDKLLVTTKDNFRLQARRPAVNHNTERKLSDWYKAIPALAKIPRDRRDYLLTVCNNAELGITPSQIEANRSLKGVLYSRA